MWRQSQRIARQVFSSGIARAAAPSSASAKAAVAKAAASCSGRQASGGLASSAGFQTFKVLCADMDHMHVPS